MQVLTVKSGPRCTLITLFRVSQEDGQTRKEAHKCQILLPPTIQLAELVEVTWDTHCPWQVWQSSSSTQIWEKAKGLGAEGRHSVVPGPSGVLMVSAALSY